jgi:formimidoylglutamase
MNDSQPMHTMVSPFNELVMVDYGDIAIDQMSTERSLEHIREIVREVATTGTIPFIVGGDHSLMYPDAAGVVDVYGAGNVGIVHFDAHYDAGRGSAHMISHGQPVRRLFDEGLVPGQNFIQVGLRGSWPSNRGFEWMRENGLRYHTMAEIEKNGWAPTMDRVLDEALDGPEKLFISFDVDVLDPAYMPGTGTPEPGGLTTREVFPIVRNLCAMNEIVGFELVELNPLVDPGYTTALNATRIVRECLTGIAMRKRGITEKGYLSPLTTEHGHDQ